MSKSIDKYPYPLTFMIGGLFLLTLFPFGFIPRLPQEQSDLPPIPLLMLLGSSDSAIFTDFVETAIASSNQNAVDILILPAGLASDSEHISDDERQALLSKVEEQRKQIAAICDAKAGSSKTCRVIAAPILVRNDALSPEARQYFKERPTAILILDNGISSASKVLQNTPLEETLKEAYLNGTLVAGGKSLLGSNISGFSPGFQLETGLDYGAVEVTQEPVRSQSAYQIQNSLFETGFFQENKFTELVNALTMPGSPQIGIGLDNSSTVQVSSNRYVNNPTGFSVVPILDAETYHAADGVKYQGKSNTLSLRNILFHLLTPGAYSYDLQSRRHSLAAPPERIVRSFEDLKIPDTAGPLMLSGKLDLADTGNPVLSQFIDFSGGQNARILVLAGGYPTLESAQEEADQIVAQIPVPAEIQYFSTENGEPTELPPGTTGIILLARYPSLLAGADLQKVTEAWKAGMPVMAVDAAASLAGASFVSQELPSANETGSIRRPFYFGLTSTEPGFQWVNFNIEPQVNSENRWGRWIHLAYYQPDKLSIGLEEDSALILTPSGTFTIGKHPIALLDLRQATLGLAPTGALLFANGLVDFFSPGEVVFPRIADINAQPMQIASPVVITPTTQLAQTQQTVTPTPTPPATPAATEIGFGIPIPDLPFQPGAILRPPPGRLLTVLLVSLPVLIVLVILLGLWVNRQHLS